MTESRKFIIAIGLITAMGFALRAYGLGSQPLTGDDVMVAVSAVNYMDTGHLGPTMWNHPNMRNVLVYFSLWASGGGIWGLKAVSLSLGVLSIPLLGLIAMRLLKLREAAYLSAFFLALDPIHIDFSRQAVQEVYMMFFAMLGIYSALRAEGGLKPLPLIVSGVSFGLGIASKWYVAFPLAVTWAYVTWLAASSTSLKKGDKVSSVALVSSAIIVLPAIVYLLTYLPWFWRGYGLSDWLGLHVTLLRETRHHTGYHAYQIEMDTKAALWFLKPVAYADLIKRAVEPIVLIGISNPLVWLLTLPAAVYAAYRGVKDRAGELIFIAALFWFTYAPFALTKRPIWAHTAFSVLPFAFMAISFGVFSLLKNSSRRKAIIAVYLFLIILVFIPLYLLSTGYGLDINWLRSITMMYRPSFER